MLVLQKASAGSGKTYTLARQYIIFLITTLTDDGRVRLRTREELEDSARHILAITFTNKATAEMKERIVIRLADLADKDRPTEDTPYLSEIMQLTDSSEEEVRLTAATALAVLLNNYSDFRVSTIDSFFQTILRTFAYEIGLNDSYGLEMDGDFIAVSSFDATLSDVNTPEGSRNVRDWLSALMTAMADNKEKQWNLFAKSGFNGSLYQSVIQAIKKMSGEDFKLIRETLRMYYDSRGNTLADYRELDNYFMAPLAEAVTRGKKAAADAMAVLPWVKNDLGTHTESRIRKMRDATVDKGAGFSFSGTPENARATTFKKDISPDASPDHSRLADAYMEVVRANLDYISASETPHFKLWQLYKTNIRFLPLMLAAAEKSAAMLAANNVVDISETNAILSRVIGDDDTPFIYERMGVRLHHYLIDEFQDTSKMQWHNLRPLIDESMSHDFGNLIIGDAKQSIYRFRNADPSLITARVPADYPHRIDSRGASKEENTNHRSLRTIVETNNSIFYDFARCMDELQAESGDSGGFFRNLYSNTAQYPSKHDRLGYFSMQFVKSSKRADGMPEHFSGIGDLVISLVKRGFKMADIAILVRKNIEGNQVVQALREYNQQHPDSNIAVISEESLLIASSEAVKTILSVLRLIAEGALIPKEETADADLNPEEKHREKMSLALFNCRYQLIALHHPELSPQEVIAHINDDTTDDAPLRELLQSVDSLTLPSLVETIVMLFVSDRNRGADAPFIAAFQDLVLDYCERYPSDILSFLQWWDVKAPKAAISSPQGLDAVTVMTVHKAKGLEYPCVIIPDLSDNVEPSIKKTEWLWVNTDVEALQLPEKLREMIPAMLPVETLPKMLDTPHRDKYVEYLREYRMDVINTWYVAFTRAVAELYVIAPVESTDTKKVSTHIAQSLMAVSAGGDPAPYGIPAEMVEIETEEEKGKCKIKSISIGRPLPAEAISKYCNKIDSADDTILIDRYYVTDPREVLHFRDPEGGYRYREDPDPRTMGNRLHDIMAGIVTRDSLDRAVRERMVNGYLTRAEAIEAQELLAKKLDDPRVILWFAPGLRVINERSLLSRGGEQSRPDRIVVDSEGRATVIDYKFGTHRNDNAYRRQVRRYMMQLAGSGRFTLVKGYIWYVMLDEIIEVNM